MIRTFLALSAAAFLISMTNAGAQTMSAMVVPPPPSVSRPVPDARAGITLVATGTTSAPADSAYVSLHVSGAHITQETLQSIADAMIAAGMRRDTVVVPPYMQFPHVQTQFVTMAGQVDHPTQQSMTRAVPIIGMAFARAGLAIPNADVRFRVDDCSPLIAQAEATALRDARAHAQRLAKDAGLHLGDIDAISSYGYTNARSCESMTFLPVQSGEQQDPTKDMNVHVTVNLTVHFALKP